MLQFNIKNECVDFKPEINYVLKIWAKNQQVEYSFSDSPETSVTIGYQDANLIIANPILSHDRPALNKEGMIQNQFGRTDVFGTILYLLNSCQEYDDHNCDELGRFKFSDSLQHQYKIARVNTVQRCFDQITKVTGLLPRKEKSRFFLSHDIDNVNGAILEDGFNVIRKGRIDIFFKLLINVAMGKPDWLNIDQIMKIESEYDCKSTFFWIVNKGTLNKREKNADYDFRSEKIQRLFSSVEQNGFDNGIHKSISPDSFKKEFEKYGETPIANRYHYLKFNLPQAYHHIEEAGLKIDASLGFAEEIGFRNSYGLPFNPYDFESRKPFSFVEVPLHVMDRTFFQYKKLSVAEVEKEIFAFFESNKENCALSILWHNNFFTNYKFKGYLELYKKILAYIRESNYRTLSLDELIKKYTIA